MTTTTLATSPAPRPAGVERSHDGLFAALQKRLAAYRTYRRTLDELRSLDPRSRADIGMDGRTPETFARAAIYGAR